MTTVRCPICRREAPWEGNPDRPFCSERCKLMDLGNWVTERYRVPEQEPEKRSTGDDDEPRD